MGKIKDFRMKLCKSSTEGGDLQLHAKSETRLWQSRTITRFLTFVPEKEGQDYEMETEISSATSSMVIRFGFKNTDKTM